jgi:hypothetical protein
MTSVVADGILVLGLDAWARPRAGQDFEILNM